MENQQVILLRKNLKDNTTVFSAPSKCSHWKALGHFDEIYIYDLPQVSEGAPILRPIQAEKHRLEKYSNDETYCYPLFLFPRDPDMPPEFDSYRFLAVVRVHFTSTISSRTNYQKLCGILGGFEVAHRCHYATEFSDMVADIRANNLNQLIEAVFTFCQDEAIGKTYTYFGINTEFLASETDCTDPEDEIPLFNIRFEQMNEATAETIQTVRDTITDLQSYFVAGVDDLLLHRENVPTQQLVTLFRKWFSKCSYPASSSTIRIGASLEAQSKVRSDELDTLCTDMMTARKKLAVLYAKESPLWFPAVSKIAFSLARMCSTPVTDEVIYLLVPAITAFLNYMAQPDRTIPEEMCYRFVESCTYFMEQLMRIEGQLSQKAETRPVIYDIPVFMLEYTVAFIGEVSQLLTRGDRLHSEPQRKPTVFLLIPRPCERVCATEIISADTRNEGLVQLEVPENNLYDPQTFLRVVCHELSHYVGETDRRRRERKKYYCTAAAVLLASIIWDGQINPVPTELIVKISKDFEQELSVSNVDYLSEMSDRLIDCALRNLPFYFLTAVKNRAADSHALRGCASEFRCHLMQNLETLFRECYADICMLHILNVDAESYVNILLQELPEDASQKEKENRELFAMRIYAVLTACGKSFRYDRERYCAVGPEVERSWARIFNALQEDVISSPLVLPYSCIDALTEYAKCCYESLCGNIRYDDTEGVRAMFAAVTDGTSYSEILKEIDKSRSHLIK